MDNNKRLALNMSFTIISFVITTCVSFFLTPYIVRHLGRAAYGFLGLSTNIIGYTSLITVALNAMAGRFISISYMKGNVEGANKYFSSVFFSNLILAGAILVLSAFFLYYIDILLDVPPNLLGDVRLLFLILTMNSMIGLVTNQYAIATFIKNKLYLNSIRGIIATLLSALTLLVSYGFFPAHLWYNGLSGIIITVYTVWFNVKYRNTLTPDLRVNIRNFDIHRVLELIKSGAWNIITKLSDILSQGLDLLFANLFVGAAAMGTFSISKTIPMMALSLMSQIANTFSPHVTNLYANGQIDQIVHELKKSIRVTSCFSTPVLCSLYVFSGDFFHLWLPGQDNNQLWLLTVLGFIASPFTMPQEALWNVFTITNKLKLSSLALLCESVGVFTTILVMMNFIKEPASRLIVLACTRTVWGAFRSAFFLPMYSAHCLGKSKFTFYKEILHSVGALVVACSICWLLREVLPVHSWIKLIMDIAITCVIGFTINFYFVMTKNDKHYLLSKVPLLKKE